MNRPLWATCLAAFCALSFVFLVTRDLFIPDVRNTEVWFGFALRGWLAWLTAPLHWLLFAIGAWGYWSLRPWIWPWASVYVFYVATSHLIWNLTASSGGGWFPGLWQFAAFTLVAVALLWARPSSRSDGSDEANAQPRSASGTR